MYTVQCTHISVVCGHLTHTAMLLSARHRSLTTTSSNSSTEVVQALHSRSELVDVDWCSWCGHCRYCGGPWGARYLLFLLGQLTLLDTLPTALPCRQVRSRGRGCQGQWVRPKAHIIQPCIILLQLLLRYICRQPYC